MIDNKIVIDEPSVKIVKNIFNDYINGTSCLEIVKKLNEENILYGKPKKYMTYYLIMNIQEQQLMFLRIVQRVKEK